MTWLALTDHHDRRFSIRGLGTDKKDEPQILDDPRSLMTRGSILFETRLPDDGPPQILFGYKTTYPWLRSLTFQTIPGGGIALVQVQGKTTTHAAIQCRDVAATDAIRITYAWDSLAKWGRMTLEVPGNTKLINVHVDNPRPLSLDDVRDLMLGRGDFSFSSDMIFAALSDQIEPIGPMPSLLSGTPIATPRGYQPASQLKRGDTVMTGEAGVVPVLQSIGRTVPARGSYRPIRLRAPYFGLQQDVIVCPDQRLLIDGPEVEYLFNQEAVLVSARHLINGFAALEEPCGTTINYAQVLLPNHEPLIAAGTALESLYIGRLRRNARHLHSSLLHGVDQTRLPEHPRRAHPVLEWHDAIHLARQRAA